MSPFSNPVRSSTAAKDAIYPYYAGFSDGFVEDALQWVTEEKVAPLILDPWNGAGTTTRIGSQKKIRTLGLDLNPVMVLVSNAELVSAADSVVIVPLSRKIARYADSELPRSPAPSLEPLATKRTAECVKGLALAIWLHLVDEKAPTQTGKGVDDIAPIPSLLFVALFNVVRQLLSPLATSNPTWLKIPTSSGDKVKCSHGKLEALFIAECQRLAMLLNGRKYTSSLQQYAISKKADSRELPLENASIDGVVTSPPYCTRLDYGRATIAELLVLESIGLADYEEARGLLIGNSITRGTIYGEPQKQWGPTCVRLLNNIYEHPSQASKTYYYKSHYAYFESMSASVSELSRVLKRGGRACVVAQDSYYKELYTDLPTILGEMAREAGLSEVGSFRFEKRKSLCSINPGSSVYRTKRKPVETAILFEKR